MSAGLLVFPVVAGPADELASVLSPNGKWLAYVSTESGAPEVYVTRFPAGEGKWQATRTEVMRPADSRLSRALSSGTRVYGRRINHL